MKSSKNVIGACVMRLYVLLISLSVCFSASCSTEVFDDYELQPDELQNLVIFDNNYPAWKDDTTSFTLDRNHPAITVMKNRAAQIGNLEWIPINEVPKRDGVFQPGVKVKGVPYSSVKELDKFVGQEVSYYTFLTAANNPYSVLYTENVGKSPYKGSNCAAYYGTVCSMSVNYALGLDRPYGTFMYGSLPCIQCVTHQDLEHAVPGDIVYFTYGHVILIADIIKDESSILYVEILESSGDGTSYRRYAKKTVEERLNKHEWILYRYKDLDKLAYEPSPFPAIEVGLSGVPYNNELCTSRGDRVTYREGEEVVINVMAHQYDNLVVYKNGSLWKRIPLEGSSELILNDVQYGSYQAELQGDENTSGKVSFEVIQTDVNISKTSDCLRVRFTSNNGTPDYLVFCAEGGGRRFITDITDADRLAGYKAIKCVASTQDLYVKVLFKGEYGRVSNAIIPIN